MTSHLILEERPEGGIARVILNRPEARNAQNLPLLYALDDAFSRAMADPAVRVVLLEAAGPDFSSGHDLRQSLDMAEGASFRGASHNDLVHEPNGLGYMAREEEVYLGLCRKWRDLPKPTIAAVQGRCIAGGLMLAWVCDLIVAAEDALFIDPVVAMGVSGVEWFAHPWELGARKAKEMLFTGDAIDAREALSRGMVNHVVPRHSLSDFALDMARRIATRPPHALAAVKKAVNETLDIQGQRTAIELAFRIHHLTHYHNMQQHGMLGDPSGTPGAKPVLPRK
ncbi:enoyl-CoA hydratase [Sphingobium lactosutens]|uniref:enoyl-CoA hydratase n=1 Tax=Sphingobium lactosutens TaxID=522773 RepID=UPI0015BB42E2|nr:enoyl-CoA hydratase [Sphingobium lactosutens]NWK98318.1 enoyl-CoA hydratase [Sphingobium lactosutens]